MKWRWRGRCKCHVRPLRNTGAALLYLRAEQRRSKSSSADYCGASQIRARATRSIGFVSYTKPRWGIPEAVSFVYAQHAHLFFRGRIVTAQFHGHCCSSWQSRATTGRPYVCLHKSLMCVLLLLSDGFVSERGTHPQQ